MPSQEPPDNSYEDRPEPGSEEEPEGAVDYVGDRWFAGAVAGMIAGVVFGSLMMLLMSEVIEEMIPELWGIGPGIVLGGLIHLFNSVVFGLIYAAIAGIDPIEPYANDLTTGTGIGVAYGLVVWLVAAAIVMPLWLGEPVPTIDPMSIAGHVVYGAILGALYPAIRAWTGGWLGESPLASSAR